jgi:GT2 family glycosyltransferase
VSTIDSPVFSLIVLVHDPYDRFVSGGVIAPLLESVFSLNGNFEVVVVDNNPNNATPALRDYLDRLAPSQGFRTVHTGMNLGVAAGYNAGARACRSDSDYLVFISSDTQVVDPDSLLKMHRAIESRRDIGLAQPMSVFEDVEYLNISSRFGLQVYREYWKNRLPDSPILDLSNDEIRELQEIADRNNGLLVPVNRFGFTFLLIKRVVWREVGELDEDFPYCFENIDYLLRALKKGYKTAVVKNVFLNHRRPLVRVLCGAGTGENAGDLFRSAYQSSEKVWYRKWGAPPDTICDEAIYGKNGLRFRNLITSTRSRLGSIKRRLFA